MTSFVDSDNGLIFIHVPKTAGTAVTRCITGLDFNSNQDFFDHANKGMENRMIEYFGDAGHITTTDLRVKIGDKKYENCFSFAIMREPYDWLVSAFEWRYQFDILSNLIPYYYNNFEMFIDAFFNINEKLQSDWFTLNGEIDVDLIGSLSSLKDTVTKVSDQFGLTISPLKRINVKQQYDVSNHYANDRIITKATKLLEKDLRIYEDLFGIRKEFI